MNKLPLSLMDAGTFCAKLRDDQVRKCAGQEGALRRNLVVHLCQRKKPLVRGHYQKREEAYAGI